MFKPIHEFLSMTHRNHYIELPTRAADGHLGALSLSDYGMYTAVNITVELKLLFRIF